MREIRTNMQICRYLFCVFHAAAPWTGIALKAHSSRCSISCRSASEPGAKALVIYA